MKAAIGELREKIQESGARTLGEYFSGLNPEQQRIRTRYTARPMYLNEFEAIWSAQVPHHAGLSDEWKKRIWEAIFHQRPLKSQKGLIGMCELEPACRRAPWATMEAQRFRYLQKVNDLEIAHPDGTIQPSLLPATAHSLIEALETRAELTFDRIRSICGLKPPRGSEVKATFNLEAGGEKKLKGNSTASRLRAVLGDDFDKLAPSGFPAWSMTWSPTRRRRPFLGD